MAIEVIMPKNGMDMKEGKLLRWLKNVGDRVERNEPIMEIETDKVDMESESPASGILLARYFEEGDVIPVLTVMGYIGEEGEQVPGVSPSLEQETNTPADYTGPSNVLSSDIGPSDHEKAGAADSGRSFDFDVAVIGGGPAGYTAAIRAAQLGGKVILFEKNKLGGTCLNRGCIPTKTYIKTAEYMRHIRRAAERGIVSDPHAAVDMARVEAYKESVVERLTGGIAVLLRSNQVLVEKGDAELADDHTVVCNGKPFTAGKIIICSGSRPAQLPIPGADHPAVIDSDGILSAKKLPEKLCVIGGGVVGCEIACAFRAFGSQVTVIEMLPRLVANMDEAVSEAIQRSLAADGVEIYTGTAVKSIEDASEKMAAVVTETGRIECDRVLVAAGRRADLDCLGALKDKIRMEYGSIVVNDRMETNITGIYAAGDATGKFMLAHAAFKMAETAAANAMGGNETSPLNYVPSCVYTIPEAAGVGLSEREARSRHGSGVSVGVFPLAANGRSLASGEGEGFVKVIIEKTFGEILGVHIVGTNAAEMIAEPAALMSMEITAYEVVDNMVHAHPTFMEAFMEACADALGRSIHLPKKNV